MYKNVKPYMGVVKLGPKGQIVIPKEVRDMFGVDSGDSMVLLARPDKGIAIQKMDVLTDIADKIFEGKGKDVDPGESDENLENFAKRIKTEENNIK